MQKPLSVRKCTREGLFCIDNIAVVWYHKTTINYSIWRQCMRRFSEYISSQFSNPRGVVGKICCMLMNLLNQAMYRKVLSVVSLAEQAKVLDIGYGNGYLIEQLYQNYHPDIYGIDISEDMKRNAEKRNQDAVKSGKLHLEVGDCCQLPYADALFDAVTSINTIYFWRNPLLGLQEIHRTLRSGGVFYNVVYTKEWLQQISYTRTGFQFFEPEDFLELGKKAGFAEMSIRQIANGKSYMVVYKK